MDELRDLTKRIQLMMQLLNETADELFDTEKWQNLDSPEQQAELERIGRNLEYFDSKVTELELALENTLETPIAPI